MRLPVLLSCFAIALAAGCSRESADTASAPAPKAEAAAVTKAVEKGVIGGR